MEQTFMTIHNLSPEANILWASDSIADILGYEPHEVQYRSSFEYFHPDEVPFARSIHNRGVLLDKAAVLHYARLQARDGSWVSCECCFTVVHDVLVACTSIYQRGAKSARRAFEAPQIRRIFSSSPRDPRYHMLEHLSPKFKTPPTVREPRAALILNRFSRTLNIMYATDAVASILGIRADQIRDKSFYWCIAENCLTDAVRCLESAKSNDSIAYLRFWFRDPRDEEEIAAEVEGAQQEANQNQPSSPSSDSDGGASLHSHSPMDLDGDAGPSQDIKSEPLSPDQARAELFQNLALASQPSSSSNTGSSQIHATQPHPTPAEPSAPEVLPPPSPRPVPDYARPRRREPLPSVELEAVVSCTSDGLVVILRKARPVIPALHPPMMPVQFDNGLFAAPWGAQPINPHYPPEMYHHFRAPYLPEHMPLQDHAQATGPPIDLLMRSIRDVAVFAWALVGINGSLAKYSKGKPQGEAAPPDGLPIWDPNAQTSYLGPENQAAKKWSQLESNGSSSSYVPNYRVNAPQHYGATAGFNDINYTYSRQPLWPPGHDSQPAFSRPQQQHPQHPPPAYHDLPMQDQWTEASAAYTGQQPIIDHTVPTTQPPSSGSQHGNHDFRDMRR